MKLGVWFCNSIGYVSWIKLDFFQFDIAFCILSSAARLMRDRQTGRMKGFGFVKYSSQAEAEKAVKAMDGRVCAFCFVHLFPLKTWFTDANKLWCLQIVSFSCCHLFYTILKKIHDRMVWALMSSLLSWTISKVLIFTFSIPTHILTSWMS
jgi:RNA recognition motif-containing protein